MNCPLCRGVVRNDYPSAVVYHFECLYKSIQASLKAVGYVLPEKRPKANEKVNEVTNRR